MAPHLVDVPVLEHDDQVGHAHRREPMRHQHGDRPCLRRPRRAAAAYRLNNSCSDCAFRLAVGSSRIRSSGAARIMARPSASFCRCPPDSSAPTSQSRPNSVSSPSGNRPTTSAAPARASSASTAARSSISGRSPTPCFGYFLHPFMPSSKILWLAVAT